MINSKIWYIIKEVQRKYSGVYIIALIMQNTTIAILSTARYIGTINGVHTKFSRDLSPMI